MDVTQSASEERLDDSTPRAGNHPRTQRTGCCGTAMGQRLLDETQSASEAPLNDRTPRGKPSRCAFSRCAAHVVFRMSAAYDAYGSTRRVSAIPMLQGGSCCVSAKSVSSSECCVVARHSRRSPAEPMSHAGGVRVNVGRTESPRSGVCICPRHAMEMASSIGTRLRRHGTTPFANRPSIKTWLFSEGGETNDGMLGRSLHTYEARVRARSGWGAGGGARKVRRGAESAVSFKVSSRLRASLGAHAMAQNSIHPLIAHRETTPHIQTEAFSSRGVSVYEYVYSVTNGNTTPTDQPNIDSCELY